jgi:hypothetical protein
MDDQGDAVPALCRKYPEAKADLIDSMAAFESLKATCDPKLIEKWSQQAAKAQRDRDTREDAMDIYDVTTEKGFSCSNSCGHTLIERIAPGQAKIQLELVLEEEFNAPLRGAVTWLACGLGIEESQ